MKRASPSSAACGSSRSSRSPRQAPRATTRRSPARAAPSSRRSSPPGRRPSARRSATRCSTARSAPAPASRRSRTARSTSAPPTRRSRPTRQTACKGCVQIPWALSATSIAYNVPGAPAHLNLDGKTIAKIFLGKITNWNDPAIKALNKGANMPNLKITPIFRSDGSGTTYNFTDYLSAVSPASGSRRSATRRPSPSRPASAPAAPPASRASSPAPRAASPTSTSRSRSRTTSSSRRSATPPGKFLFPSLRRITEAAEAFTKVPADNELHIVNPPKKYAARLPDLDLHLRDRAAADVARRGAAEDRLLGADAGPEVAVHREAPLRAAAEAGPGRFREDAQDRSPVSTTDEAAEGAPGGRPFGRSGRERAADAEAVAAARRRPARRRPPRPPCA